MKPDKIIRTKRKTISIQIGVDGTIVVRAPHRVTNRQIEKLLDERRDWIMQKQAVASEMRAQLKPKSYKAGESFYYLGKTFPLAVVDHQRQLLSLDGHFSLRRDKLPEAEAVFTEWYRKQARKVFTERVEYFAQKYGFEYKSLRITSAKTRWGSCSSRKSLNFTWRLVMAPLSIIDYVVVHELCHLRQQNHSKAFWNEVAKILPDYKQRRKWLKTNGHLFHL